MRQKVKYTHWEKATSKETPALAKSGNIGFWVVDTTNQFYIEGS